jgi:transcriptional regulator with XRE-family HTH domain
MACFFTLVEGGHGVKSIKETVRHNIRRLRQGAGLSQQKLADRPGQSLRSISYLENNDSNVTIEVLQQLAKGIGVSVSALVSDGSEGELAVPRNAVVGLRYIQGLINEKLVALDQADSDNPPNEGDRGESSVPPILRSKKKPRTKTR